MNAVPKPSCPAPTMAAASRRKLWFLIHSWSGMKFSLLMAFVCATGTLAVISMELEWLAHSELRVEPAPRRASWGEMAAAAQAAHPDWVLQTVTAPYASRFAAEALMRTQQGERRFVWIDPYRATVTGDTSWFGVRRWLRNTHRHLFLPTRYGVPLVSALSIPLLLLLASGTVVYKRWWRGFLAWPRSGKPRVKWGDIHRLLGVWSLWFIAIMALTGLWYLVESLGGNAPPLRAIAPKAAHQSAGQSNAAELDAAITRVRQQWPDLQIRVLRLDAHGQGGQVEGQAQAWLVRDRANAIRLPLRDGEPAARRNAMELNVHQRIAELADPIHFGAFGPWPVRVIWFVFGAALTALSLTGAYLYGLRIAGASAAGRLKAGGPSVPASPAREGWRGMRRLRWVWLGLLALSQALFVGELLGWLHLFQ
ncbi:PepSY-associated TM helix domain-containing protein [Achromobacter aegrifaciens]|uniref:PepSY-associated TM helix domain-containing protein n=1 Tax=Achromobacter aegrifaciens TaxID=1287736 RepID=UPI00320B6B13